MPQIATRKVTLSLPEELVAFADSKATQQGMTRSHLISDLLAELHQREQDAFASEGYRFYANESEDFAEASSEAVAEAIADDRSTW